ncbi:hypothetical protein UA70_03700 [Raoultella planticola]|nr:hypothetical protein UA70_03700 [Raoultella planticola]
MFGILRLLTNDAEGDFQTIHPTTRTAPRQNIDNLRMGKPLFSEGRNCAALKRSRRVKAVPPAR